MPMQRSTHLTCLPKWLLMLFIGSLSSTANALEVGEITLLSKLGAPLSAQLTVSEHGPLDTQALIIEPADTTIYQQMGMDYTSINQQLIITTQPDGLVHISTRTPIKEPLISFILKFQWPNGEIYRSYQLLIDPS